MGNTFSVNMKKVYELTQKKFWTIAELGRQAHLSQATIFSLKAKRRNASMLTVNKLAAALDVSPAEIIEK
ncbi:helix-turn-helix transcriptional regulator [uncultured Acidaminococcus sp.]|uniref:helix-turn-helix domain-containing protein n=1 Tax=uncultured Acidaminococcus sp. TaxID=352152 RepID=UPI002666F080|nr:helix-turn-helix transcriptional regulator [uncultured Acidaminococcus sp.]